jgi:DNA-binding NarL/FixJ family response regulator
MEGLRSLMEAMDGPRVVVAETNVEVAVPAVRDLQPSVLVVDKGFGIPALTDWVRLLSAADKPTAMIVWGVIMSEPDAVRLLQAGVAGIIRKTASLVNLAECIQAVAAGGNWMENEVLRDPRMPPRMPCCVLTPREVQVMELVERGYRNKDIGLSLGIRTGTVKIHLKHIFEKTGIRGRYGLALSGLKHKGLLAATV